MIRWLSGSEAVSVIADGVTTAYPDLKTLGDQDTTMTIIRLANGALAHVDASGSASMATTSAQR